MKWPFMKVICFAKQKPGEISLWQRFSKVLRFWGTPWTQMISTTHHHNKKI